MTTPTHGRDTLRRADVYAQVRGLLRADRLRNAANRRQRGPESYEDALFDVLHALGIPHTPPPAW